MKVALGSKIFESPWGVENILFSHNRYEIKNHKIIKII